MPKGGKIINLLGQKFGMVTAIEIMGKNKSGFGFLLLRIKEQISMLTNPNHRYLLLLKSTSLSHLVSFQKTQLYIFLPPLVAQEQYLQDYNRR